MKPSDVSATTLILVVLVATLFYAVLIFWAGGGRFITPLQSLSWSTLISVLVLVSVGYGLRFIRWHYYLEEMGHDVPILADFRIFCASFLMAISPGKVGEAMKSYFLKKEFNVPATPTIAAFFCERFTDVLAMIILSSAGLLVFPKGNYLLLLILLLQILFLYLLQKRQLIQEWVFDPLDNYDRISPWVEKLERFYGRSGELLSFRNLSYGTILGLLAWGLEGYCFALITWDIGGGLISSPTAIFIFASSVLLGTAAMLPGGLGSSEALMIGMLVFHGYTRVDSVASTVLIRLMTLWYAVAVGLIAWIWSLRVMQRLETESIETQSSAAE